MLPAVRPFCRISMAKSLGGGFPIGAFWVRQPHADLLGPGTHATTFGGTPLGCAVALKILEVVEREQLASHVRQLGDSLKTGLQCLIGQYPSVIKSVRGLGLMIGIELASNIAALAKEEKAPSIQFVNRLHEAGLLTIPAGNQVVRLLPPLNLQPAQGEEGVQIIKSVVSKLV
jgi:acetylornithine/N-succinyldiaminopimelate aminotransferase